jgi:hypothetical protein
MCRAGQVALATTVASPGGHRRAPNPRRAPPRRDDDRGADDGGAPVEVDCDRTERCARQGDRERQEIDAAECRQRRQRRRHEGRSDLVEWGAEQTARAQHLGECEAGGRREREPRAAQPLSRECGERRGQREGEAFDEGRPRVEEKAHRPQ